MEESKPHRRPAIFDRLRVFVSSRIEELQEERAEVKDALEALQVAAWVYEDDAGARGESTSYTSLDEVGKADLYLGIFWRGFGAYTGKEFDEARKLGKPCFLYERRTGIEGTRTAQLQSFLDRVNDPEDGVSVRWFDAPSDLAVLVKEDIARWSAEIVKQRVSPGHQGTSRPTSQTREGLLVLLRRVQEFWIKGVLEASLQAEAMLELGAETRPDLIENPWSQILEVPGGEPAAILADKPLLDTFEESGRRLLILGEPGSGKTVTLLRLARDLAARAEQEETDPIPAVFNLSSWVDPTQDFRSWLLQELQQKYRVPPKLGAAWLDQERLHLLLDGFDELPVPRRSRVIEELNRQVETVGPTGIVVSSRTLDYTALPTRLRFGAALCLEPLSPTQVNEYLDRLGDRVQSLRVAIESDAELARLAETPLMLNVMALTYEGDSADRPTGAGKKQLTLRRRVFDAYIDSMFRRRGGNESSFQKEDVIANLSSLARNMVRKSQTVFQLETLQPDWAARPGLYWAYFISSRVGLGLWFAFVVLLLSEGEDLILTLAGILPASAAAGVLDGRGGIEEGAKSGRGLPGLAWRSLVVMALVGLPALLIGEPGAKLAQAILLVVLLGLPFAIVWLMSQGGRVRQLEIQPVETLKWSWPRGLLSGLVAGAGGFTIGFAGNLLVVTLLGFDLSFREAAVYGAALGLPSAVFLGVSRGFQPSLIDTKTRFSEGLRLSVKHSIIGALAVSILFALLFTGFAYLRPEADVLETSTALLLSACLGLSATIWLGGLDLAQHFLLRGLLAASGEIPFRLERFLEFARERVFLRRVGGGYVFIHRMLLEHFAERKA